MYSRLKGDNPLIKLAYENPVVCQLWYLFFSAIRMDTLKATHSPGPAKLFSGLIVKVSFSAFERLSPLLIPITFVFMFLLSMAKWPDPLVDFGRELYVPWAMLQGKQLYSDMFYFNGPLSPYCNFIIFKLLGIGINKIIFVNIIFLLSIVFFLFNILKMASSHWSAMFGCIAFLLLFAFSQYVGIGNYNFITPYSHEVTHGMLLSLAMLFCVGRSLFTKNILWVPCAGFLLGLIFLTKPEFFVAASCGMVAFLGVNLAIQPSKKSFGSVFAVLFTMAVPVLGGFFLLSKVIPAQSALKGTLGGWFYLGQSSLASLKFYQSISGIIDINHNIYMLLIFLLAYILCLGLPFVSSHLQLNRVASWFIAAVPALSLFVLFLFHEPIPIAGFARPFPIFVLAVGIWALYAVVKRKSSKSAILFVFCVFAGTLLIRIFLNVRIYHYGFALAMPAFMVSLLLFFYIIPGKLKSRNKRRGPYLFGLSLITIFVISWHLVITTNIYSKKIIPIKSNQDFFYSDFRGQFLNAAVDWITENTLEGRTLLVLPEGIMINYLARRINPTPILNLMPPEMIMFGEDKLLNALKSAPPDYLVLVHKDTSEYGWEHYRFVNKN